MEEKVTMFDYRQLPIKAGWRDAAHALQDFSSGNKYKISWLFLISCQDWVIRFLKSYMLDYILYKMAAMFINIILYTCYLKVFPRRRLLLCYLWQLKVLLKRWKMLFISPQKLFSFSKYLSFCHDFLIMWQNDLKRRIRLISDFMMSQPG